MTKPAKSKTPPEEVEAGPEAEAPGADPAEQIEPIPGEAILGPAPQRRWGWRHGAAAVAGGGLVAIGAWIAGVLEGGQQLVRIDALEARNGALERAVEAVDAGAGAQDRRLDGIEQSLAALTDAIGGAVAAADFGVLAADVDGRLGALEDAQAALDAGRRLTELEAGVGPAASGPAAPDGAMTARLAELEAALEGLRVALAARPQAAEAAGPGADALAPVLARLAAVEAALEAFGQAAGPRSGAATLVLAAGQLRERLRGAGPFQVELDAIRQVAASQQLADEELEAALGRLDGGAAAGVATVEELARSFPGVAGEIVDATVTQPDGWAGALWKRMQSVVSVRRTGEVEGEGAEARVARAEVRLAQDDLVGAVFELEGLAGPASAAAAPWLADAKARMAADEAAAVVTARAIALLAQDFGAAQ